MFLNKNTKDQYEKRGIINSVAFFDILDNLDKDRSNESVFQKTFLEFFSHLKVLNFIWCLYWYLVAGRERVAENRRENLD